MEWRVIDWNEVCYVLFSLLWGMCFFSCLFFYWIPECCCRILIVILRIVVQYDFLTNSRARKPQTRSEFEVATMFEFNGPFYAICWKLLHSNRCWNGSTNRRQDIQSAFFGCRTDSEKREKSIYKLRVRITKCSASPRGYRAGEVER